MRIRRTSGRAETRSCPTSGFAGPQNDLLNATIQHRSRIGASRAHVEERPRAIPRWVVRYITFYIRPGSAPSIHTLELTQFAHIHIHTYPLCFFLTPCVMKPYSRRARSLTRTRCSLLRRALCLSLSLLLSSSLLRTGLPRLL